MKQRKRLAFEIRRKLFHLSALLLPLLYLFLSKITMSVFLVFLTGIALYLDISRHYNTKIQHYISLFFSSIMRVEEQNTNMLSSASYMAFGFLLTCLFFAKAVAIISLIVLVVADIAAAIIGIKFGKALFNGKSLAGSMSFFLSAFLIGCIGRITIGCPQNLTIIIWSALITTIVEFFSKNLKMDDNMTIPITYGAVVSLLGVMS